MTIVIIFDLTHAIIDHGLFVNKIIQRHLYIMSQIVREEVRVKVEATSDSIGKYILAIPKELSGQECVIRVSSRNEFLKIEKLSSKHSFIEEQGGDGLGKQIHLGNCYAVDISNLPGGRVKDLTIGISYVGRMKTNPKVQPQGSPLLMKVEFGHLFNSPYPTEEEQTVVALIPTFKLIQLNAPGWPPNKIPMKADSSYPLPEASLFVIDTHQKTSNLAGENIKTSSISVQVAGQMFLHIPKYERKVEVDSLGQQLYFEDSYEFKSDSYRFSDGEFSRAKFYESLQRDPQSILIYRILPVGIPASAENIVIRDELGIINTNINRNPAPASSAPTHFLEFMPRFPLGGGWNLKIQVTYQAPLKLFCSKGKVTDVSVHQNLIIPTFSLYSDTYIKNFFFTVILPSGATILQQADSENGLVEFDNKIFPLIFPEITLSENYAVLYSGKKKKVTVKVTNVTREQSFSAKLSFYLPWYRMYMLHLLMVTFTLLLIAIVHLRQRLPISAKFFS